MGWLHGVLIAWGAACSALTIALVSVVSVRIFAMAMDAARGLAFSLLFAGFFGVVVLGVLGFLVYGYSRGNALGRRLAAYGALNEETDGLVESHVGSGRAALDAAEEQLVLMRADLAEAEEVEIRHNAEVIQAIQASAAVLRVTDLAFDVQRRIPLGTSIRDEIQALASSVHADAGVQRLRISGIERKEPAVPLPHESDHLERPGAVGLDELDPARVGAVVVPEQHDHRRSVRPRTLLLAALAVLVVASAIAASLVIATGAARASAAAAAPPADLVEGRDYSFLGTAANGPERWSCAAPIEVRLADGSPAGSADVVASAVASIARTSGLPLRIGSSYDAGILISYVPSPDVQRLGGSDEAIGVTSTRTDDEGAIRHADVEIAADAAVNAPGTTTAEFTMLHELGHAVGLGHATRKDEIMTPVLDPATAPVLGRGDVAALHAVGCRQS
ncbi:hypothetical protein GCM10025881_01940 [Pseudolysinimonas kribbensis]|uniref:Peptidase M10 metallopeptidase domain-containing protein n=1 Tax=Pseudolysinimonas kribbensis TaxID=433641 RepID=A0ABQ6K2T3_9MICO|nr:matrixin family metalloprotease [Pseudolysinimonas kribbensis]GMA93370.1 hypothetical protein GCM10025881_01940 [Pseudolysinimonas kribbensis]